jgi:hypothetical protein
MGLQRETAFFMGDNEPSSCLRMFSNCGILVLCEHDCVEVGCVGYYM